MSEKLLFVQDGDYYRLRCPKCSQIDPEQVAASTLAELQAKGVSSFCIECDPLAEETIPYKLSEKGRLTASVISAFEGMQGLVEFARSNNHPNEVYFEGERNAYKHVLKLIEQA